MRIIAIILNVIMALFTLMVFVTDGFATRPIYILFSILLLLVPLLNITVFASSCKRGDAGQADVSSTRTRNLVIVANVLLIASVIWTLIDQYPHPKEPGYIEYMVALFLTPLFSLVTVLCSK